MSCNKKIKYTCGNKVPSTCVFYNLEETIPEFSNLNGESCIVIEETTHDLYELIKSIKLSIDLDDFDKGCLDIDKVKDPYDKKDKYLVKDVLTALKNKVCAESSSGSDEQNIEWILNNLDYKCLVLPCNAKPKNLFQFFQLLIDKLCPNG
jgi:hypothetical protein